MLRIINEGNTSVLQFEITDTTTGETLLAANSLIELFLILQDCVYAVANEVACDSVIKEKLKHRHHSQNAQKC